MVVREYEYEDFNGTKRKEKYYFDLSEAEVMEMEMSISGGLAETIQRIVEAQDAPEIIKIFKEIIFKAYGEKSPDGKYFNKSEELSKAFSHTKAYSMLFMELATDSVKAAEFMNGIIPDNTKTTAAINGPTLVK